MKLTRRQVLVASAATSAYLNGTLNALAATTDSQGTLITKTIPSTGERLPVIGLGTNRWVAAGSKSEIYGLRATLNAFSELGGRVIDTAPSYRTSEKAIGQLLQEQGIENPFFLATKVDRSDKEAGIARMQDSLLKLGTPTVDLMQIHNMIGAEQQIETLLEWKEQGLIRYVGITTSNKDQFAEMESLMNSMPVDFIQLNYSLRDRQAEQRLLPLAIDKKIAVMVNRPFAHGHLFKAFAKQTLPDWSAEFDCKSWAQFFLKYAISHPAATCAIPGTTKEAHVRDNMAAGHGALPNAALRKKQEQLFASI